jgi:glycosyltransferase involved in cell wall biosynthesis
VISFLVPFRSNGDEHRQRAFDYVVSSLRSFPDSEIVIGNNVGEFNRSRARNLAALRAKGDVFVFLDADSVIDDHGYILSAIHIAHRSGWCLPFSTYASLTEQCTLLYIGDEDIPDPYEWDDINHHYYEHVFPSRETPEPAVAGCVVVSRAAFEAVGGYDERFIGWGFEDRAFIRSLEVMVKPMLRGSGTIYHLWHPHPEEECFGQPHMRENQELWFRYRDANFSQMAALIKER